MDLFKFKLTRPIVFCSAAVATFGTACLIKEWSGGPRYTSEIDAAKKVVVITGASQGIGMETAWEFARRGAKVYMACRDMQSCEKARQQIVLDTENKYVYCRPCNLSSMVSVRNFVKILKSEEKKIHVLVNNAGVMRTPYSKTEDGFEMQLGVNHLAHFLLTNLLLDVLKAGAPSRIINVTSVEHLKGAINKEDLNSEKSYDKNSAYAQSKLANVLFTVELAKQLRGSGVVVNAVHPGIVDTNINRHLSFSNSWLSTIFLKPLLWPFIKSPRQGCQTVIFAALEPSLEGVTGKYYCDYKEVKPSPLVENESLTRWLWLVSEKWTRLKEN